MNTPWDADPPASQNSKVFFKGLIIAFIGAFLLAPTLLIQNLVEERQHRQQEAITEVSSKWAGAQTINGPVIAIPYWQTVSDEKGMVSRVKKKAYFLPEKLTANATVVPENRYRGIYQVTVYTTEIELGGHFGPFEFSELNIADQDVLWNEAVVYFTVSDVRGLQETLYLSWPRMRLELVPGKFADDEFPQSLSSAIIIGDMRDSPTPFHVSLKLKGSQNLMFVPLGKTTTVSLKSSWPDPSFTGNYLPDARMVKDSGFSATWNILSLNRSFPQQWTNNKYDLEGTAFGVDLVVPVDAYQKSNRSVKYAILCIVLTFTAFFLIELVYGRALHIIQYVLVGFALCIFYTLLLSISEYLGFDPAYAIASVATISLVAWYVSSSLKSSRIALFVSLLLAAMYGFIFILIQSQDYALLMGSIGLFVVLGIVMYFSRRIKALNAA
ncbi:MAG TPA: cell envelope integrity protein CreD [Chitinophagaceae bacterium]|nr:cell envelope integrity protein CreD [Chitinophagaceae bacterium]